MLSIEKNLEDKINYLEYIKNKIDYNLVLDGYKQYCYSSLGKEYLENLNPYSINPAQELQYLSELCDIVRVIGYPTSDAFLDIRSILRKIENGIIAEGLEFLSLLRFFEGIKSLKAMFKEQKPSLFQSGIVNLILGLGTYDEIINSIKKTIDENGNIKDDASVLLKKIRNEYAEVTKELRHKAERFITHHQNILQEVTYTIRNDRYVFPVKANERGKIKGIVHGMSSSGLTVYLEPEEFIPLNDKLKVLAEEEGKEIARILREITNKIFDRLSTIKGDIELLKRIDSLYARVRYVIEKNASIIIPDGNYLKLSRARHPLIPEDKIVPIDIELPSDKFGIVITGPNTGGKTVSLKTVALFIILARSGFPVLAGESSRIPDFDVYVDIGDSQNILENLSTFSGHLHNIVQLLKLADENSIVLIDELGSGTDPYEGSAIALGIIEELIERRIKFIVTTHLTPIKLFSMSHDKLISASMEFDPETLSPTYRILMNIPGASHAFEIAKKYGLPDAILERAQKHLDEEHIKIEELIKNLNKHISELETKRRELENTLREYNRQKKDFEEKYKLLKIKRIEEFDKELREVYKDIQKAKKDLQISLQSKKTESEELIKKRLKEIENEVKHLEEIQGKVEKVIYETKVTDEEKQISVGDYVRLIDGTAIGKVIEMKSRNFVVDFNGLKIEVKPEKLVKVTSGSDSKDLKKHIDEEKEKIVNVSRIPTKVYTSNLTKNEVDVRGLTVEEALEIIDEFIDQLLLSDFSIGYIIHGKGTGKLATGIWNYLRHDKRVKNYRFGRPDEGGVGATVIEV
ncbi:endonuclease MutS2 [Fervidobacterium nodosum]|uniref:Endonuclease MutS2 n=1 Tax=Fervidobacterium nodosum (strain ATCC 35602 / DSM 5306 / Rt17-B1) TaxID=381764 RepID=A7HJT1_FERNB|nr:endonuclease MutS2 [Fervidobacterium nodosum]ABS60164.1 MutS2 family protein [Fervidobacterium nodosum Rt17-B1]